MKQPLGNHDIVYLDRLRSPTSITNYQTNRSVTLDRDSMSRVTRFHNVRGNTFLFSYDTLGNVTVATDSVLGRIDSMTYQTALLDGIRITVGALTARNNLDLSESSFRYDGIRLTGSWLEASPADSTRYRLFSDGRPDSIIDPAGHVTKFFYAASGRRNTDSLRVGADVTRYEYDAAGRQTLHRGPHGDSIRFAFDGRNRLRKRWRGIGDTTVFVFDSLNLRQVIDSKGQTYAYAYNAMGWDTAHIDPIGQTQTYLYDMNGNVAKWTNRRGQVITFAYDAIDRVTSRNAAGQTTTYAYVEPDSAIFVSTAASTDSIYSDRAGLPTRAATIRGVSKYVIRSLYNQAGQREDLLLDTATILAANVQYNFGGTGLLSSLTDFGGRIPTFGYNPDFLADTVAYPTSTTTRQLLRYTSGHGESFIAYNRPPVDTIAGRYIKQDSMGRVIEAWHSVRDTFRVMRYDSLGRLHRVVINIDTSTAASCSENGNFGFDCPTTDTIGIRLFEYLYDRLGNSNLQFDSVAVGNRAIRVTTDFLAGFQSAIDTMTYDADGNLTERKSGGILQKFFWNALSQLDSVETYNSGVLHNTGRYRYDGFGRRVWRYALGDSIRYVWDGEVMVMEVDSLAKRIAALYTYLPGELSPFAMTRSGSTYYYLLDEGGSVTALLKHDGTVTNRYRNWPFGFRYQAVEGVFNPISFHGQYQDNESALTYMRNRYYDFRTRRFISEDPIGLAGGINPYVYARNDPINNSDPLGLKECEVKRVPHEQTEFESGPPVSGLAVTCRRGDRNRRWAQQWFQNFLSGMNRWFERSPINTGPGYNTGALFGIALLAGGGEGAAIRRTIPAAFPVEVKVGHFSLDSSAR